MIALVITIVILLILAGISIASLSDNGLFGKAKQAKTEYQQKANEENQKIDQYVNELDKQTGSLKSEDIQKIKSLLTNSEKTLADIRVSDYTVATDATASVTITADTNADVADQVITQTTLGATGLKWYILSADSNGVNLVSEPTTSTVRFKGFEGYDNCLYYLDQMSKKLFANSSLGVTPDRVHALRLSDIKEAVKFQNGWTDAQFKTNFIDNAPDPMKGVSNPYTTYKKYPGLYGTATAEKVINNPIYDEEPGNLITGDDGVEATTSLTVNSTSFNHFVKATVEADYGYTTQMTKLGTFGSSAIRRRDI